MNAVATATPALRRRTPRIGGVDLARAVAMLGMVVVHYVWPDGSGSALDTTVSSLSGRAMPLFMLLGGVGVSLATSRAALGDRDLVARAGILFVLGLILHEASAWVAVVLQSYGLFFALAPALRRLSNTWLLTLTTIVAAVGSVTYRSVGSPSRPTAFADVSAPSDLFTSLVFDGYYPFFPVAAFFLLGLWIGRLDLGSERVGHRLAAAGALVGIGSALVADRLVTAFGVDSSLFGTAQGPFAWGRLLDTTGHSQMTAWLISAGGTSVAVLGLSLLISPRLGRVAGPAVALGTLSLTFYAVQVVLTQVVASPRTTSFGRELLTVAAIYGGFMAFATLCKRRYRSGPLEALLRVRWSPSR